MGAAGASIPARCGRGRSTPRPAAELRPTPIGKGRRAGALFRLFAKAELRNEIGVTPLVFLTQVIEQRAALFELVERLPDDQRRVISLRFAEEKSIREVAEALSRSEGAIKQLQFRALQNLRTMEFERSGRLQGRRMEGTNG